MKDRLPGAPGRHIAVVDADQLQKMQNAEPFSITLTRDDQPAEPGTPYSKAAVLPDDVAEKLCAGVEDPTPADAFRYIGNAQLGSSREAFAAFVSSFDGYKDTNGDLIQRAGCKVYRLIMDENEKLYGKTVRIKTYAYGDMVYGWNCHSQFIPINPDADIEENPKSGIREFDVTFPEYNPDDVYEIFDVSFCENPYTDFAIYEKKGTIWEELKKLQSVEGYDAFESVLTSVKYEKQNLTPAQQAQARENIGVTFSTPEYYSTTREELGKMHDEINTDYVYSLYDALDKNYVQMNELVNDAGSVIIREYVISCNTDGKYTNEYDHDDPARKPKYLVVSGIHGSERNAVFSTYRFVRDIINGHNVPKAFSDGVVLRVIPVANPTAFDAYSYEKPNGVSIDKNFDWNWQEGKDASQNKGVFGITAASEPETQAITKWLHNNSDAIAFINYHNSGIINENVAIIGPADDNVDCLKRVAMMGIDRVIPYWKDVIGYPNVETPTEWDSEANKYKTEKKSVIFSYTASGVTPASSVGYAINVVGIPSIFMETSCYYGDFSDWWDYSANADRGAGRPSYQPEVIAMGAEALGNILIELFSKSCEVVDMTEVNDKLDALLGQVNSGFHSVSGVYTVPAGGLADASNHNNLITVALNCPPKPKMLVLQPDANTLAAIKATTKRYTLGMRAEYTSDTMEAGKDNNCLLTVWMGSNGVAQVGVTSVSSKDKVAVQCYALLEGDYNWTAYYWNK